jgi:hypothetical protein
VLDWNCIQHGSRAWFCENVLLIFLFDIHFFIFQQNACVISRKAAEQYCLVSIASLILFTIRCTCCIVEWR